jgi:hypothetical protein
MIVEDMLTFQPFFILTQQQLSLLASRCWRRGHPMAEPEIAAFCVIQQGLQDDKSPAGSSGGENSKECTVYLMREGRELSLSFCLPDLSESLSSFSLGAVIPFEKTEEVEE